MDLNNFLINVVAPKALERITEVQSDETILLGEGNPFFKNQKQSIEKMAEINKIVVGEILVDYKSQLDSAYYNLKILQQLTDPILASGRTVDETKNVINRRVKIAQSEVDQAFANYDIAFQAKSYITNFIR